MTEDQKKKMAEGRKRAAEQKKVAESVAEVVPATEEPKEKPKEKPQEGSFTLEQVQSMIAEAVAKAVAEQQVNAQKPQVVHVSTDATMVKLYYQCECSPVNVVRFGANGKFGSITGKTGKLSVKKEDFLGEFRDETVQRLLAERNLIVLDGLTDEERAIYGLSYKDGEVMDEKTFSHIVEMGDELLHIYDDLHITYREAIARRFAEVFEKRPEKIRRDLIVKLNDKSKKDYAHLPDGDIRKKGAFFAIIEAMNKKDAEN